MTPLRHSHKAAEPSPTLLEPIHHTRDSIVMTDAETATAAAQKLADQFAQEGGDVATEVPVTENGDSQNNKRKLENDGEEEEDGTRKKTSFNGPQSDLEQAAPTEAKPASEIIVAANSPVMNATGEWEESTDIPATMVGKLIGKAGETIKHLQMSTGSRVQIDHQTPGDTKRVTITATSAEAVKACKRQVEITVSDEPQAGDQSKSIDCPPGIVGRIIGRGGETIRALQQASQAHIVVDQNFPEGEMRKVNITGRQDSVERASKMVDELISGEPGSAQAIIQKYGAGISKVIDCSKSIVGRVIGKGGETIKTMQKHFGANIQIDQQTDPMKITVSGQPAAVEAAAAAVQEIVNGGNPYLGGPGGPQGYGGGGPRGQGGFGGPGFGGGQGYGNPAPFAGGYGGYGGFPGGGFGGFPGAYPQAYAQPAYGGYGGYGQDPYAAGGGGGGYGGGGHGGAAASSVWQELQDEQGRSYYYNTQTGVSQWEKPSE